MRVALSAAGRHTHRSLPSERKFQRVTPSNPLLTQSYIHIHTHTHAQSTQPYITPFIFKYTYVNSHLNPIIIFTHKHKYSCLLAIRLPAHNIQGLVESLGSLLKVQTNLSSLNFACDRRLDDLEQDLQVRPKLRLCFLNMKIVKTLLQLAYSNICLQSAVARLNEIRQESRKAVEGNELASKKIRAR